MAANYYKLVGTTNPHTNWASEYRFLNENGGVKKVVRLGEPVQLSADERKQVENAGFVLEESSKDEAEKVQAARSSGPTVGVDVAASGPVFNEPVGSVDQEPVQNDKSDKS